MVMVAVQRERSDDVVVDYADAIHGVGGQVHLAGTNLTCGVLVHHSTNLFGVFRPTFFFCQNTQKAKFIFTSKFKFILLQVSPPGEKKKSHSFFLKSTDIFIHKLRLIAKQCLTKNCGVYLRAVCHTLLSSSSLSLSELGREMNININSIY